MRATLFDAPDRGRPLHPVGPADQTVDGPDQGRVTRVSTLTVAGATVTTPVMMTIGDTLIDAH